jgi:hypothetical protein
MKSDPIAALREKVKAAVHEYDAVVQFHESWRIAAHDKALQERVSHSFVGQTFLVVRRALRREMLLALYRLWDPQTKTVHMVSVADDLENPVILDVLWPEAWMHEEPRARAAEAAALIRKYEKGGPSYSTLLELRKLRHQHLAHHQVGRKPIGIVEEYASGEGRLL